MLSVINLSSEKNLPTFRPMHSVKTLTSNFWAHVGNRWSFSLFMQQPTEKSLKDMKGFLHHCGNWPVVTKSVNIITSPVLIFSLACGKKIWECEVDYIYILALCGFELGVELVLFPDTQYDTHTILRSGKEIGWNLHGGSQTIQVCPWCKC